MAFQDPFAGVSLGRDMNDAEMIRAIRLDLASEQEAIATYEAHADAAGDDVLVQLVLLSIANEEKVHVGELQMLLDVLTGTEFMQMNKGMKEVAVQMNSSKSPQ
jgi:rubrerythrin